MLSFLIPKEVIVSSIKIYGDINEHTKLYELSKTNEEVRNRLIEFNVIKNINLEAKKEAFHFEGRLPDKILRDFIVYQTSIGELSCHGFITNNEKKLIIYPHDDCGLGFIACNDELREQYLKELKSYAERFSDILDLSLLK